MKMFTSNKLLPAGSGIHSQFCRHLKGGYVAI